MTRHLATLAPWKLAILSGVLTGLSFPPLKLGVLGWVGLVPLLRVLDSNSPARSFLFGYLAGFTSNLIALYWLSLNLGAPFPIVFASMIGAVIYLALFWAITGYLFSLIHARTGKGFWVLPFLWSSVDYLISFGPLGFPWASIATSQAEFLPVIQMVEFTGIYGISFWVVIVNTVVYRYLLIPSSNKPRLVVYGTFVMIIPWLYGYGRIAMVSQDKASDTDLTVALVQPNVGPHEKWDPSHRSWVFYHLDSLFVEAAKTHPQLIVWPESATPTYLRRNFRRLNQIRERIQETRIPLLTGTIDWEIRNGKRSIYNSVLLIPPDSQMESYHKIHLVPLGEYNPLSDLFPLSDQLSHGHFEPGYAYTVFEVEDVPFSAIICFESAFPQLVSEFVQRGAKLLVIVTNDGWFGNTSEPYQHAALARFRAVEHRIPVARCANTGISAIYDAAGRMTAKLPVGEVGIISAGISPGQVLTFYGRYGDVFAKTCFILVVILGVIFWHRQK